MWYVRYMNSIIIIDNYLKEINICFEKPSLLSRQSVPCQYSTYSVQIPPEDDECDEADP